MEPDFTARRKTGKFPLRICIRSTLAVFLSASRLATAAPTSTNEAIQRAMASVAAAAPSAQADPTRPIYHVAPPAHWNNDPNGPIYHRGWYHLFYQHNPYGDDWGNMHWGHVRSRDLSHWEHLPIALWPSKESGEDHVFSGCAVLAKGRPMIFYTSIGRGKGADVHAEQWAALGDPDLIRWRKHPSNPILTEGLHGDLKVYDWRDPFYFEHEGRHYLVIGGNLNHAQGGQAVVLLYEALNDDLTQWTYRGILFRHPDPQVKDIECPNFFRVGRKWVLLVSPYGRVEYFVGDLNPTQGEFAFQTRGLLDASDQFYAPNTLLNRGHRRVLWGWVRGFKGGLGWNGCLTVPRELALGADNTLRQAPVRELKRLRTGKAIRLAGVPLADSVRRVAGLQGDTFEAEMEWDVGTARECGLRLRAGDGSREVTLVTCSRQGINVAGTAVPFPPATTGSGIRLHLLVDRSVLEGFLSDGRAVARVIHAVGSDASVELFTSGGTATLRRFSACPMGSVWTER